MFRPNYRNFPQNVLQVYGHGPNKNVDKILDIYKERFLQFFLFGRQLKDGHYACRACEAGCKVASLGVGLPYRQSRLHKTFFFISPKYDFWAFQTAVCKLQAINRRTVSTCLVTLKVKLRVKIAKRGLGTKRVWIKFKNLRQISSSTGKLL